MILSFTLLSNLLSKLNIWKSPVYFGIPVTIGYCLYYTLLWGCVSPFFCNRQYSSVTDPFSSVLHPSNLQVWSGHQQARAQAGQLLASYSWCGSTDAAVVHYHFRCHCWLTTLTGQREFLLPPFSVTPGNYPQPPLPIWLHHSLDEALYYKSIKGFTPIPSNGNVTANYLRQQIFGSTAPPPPSLSPQQPTPIPPQITIQIHVAH